MCHEITYSNLAQDTFIALGKQLKARRKHDELDVMQSYIPLENQDDPDPAEQDEEMQKVLQESSRKSEEKMTKVRRYLFQIISDIARIIQPKHFIWET